MEENIAKDSEKVLLENARMVVADAEEKARVLVDGAAKHAQDLLKTAVEASKEKLYIDISRVPLICQSVIQINGHIAELKEMVKAENNDHEGRIRVIEKTVWKWIGLSMILPPIITIIVAWLISVLIHT